MSHYLIRTKAMVYEYLTNGEVLSRQQEMYVRSWGDQGIDVLVSQVALLVDYDNLPREFFGEPAEVAISPDRLLILLGLYEDEPDGLSMIERLTDSDQLLKLRRNDADTFSKVYSLRMLAARALQIYQTRGFDNDPVAEEIIRGLALVMSRQIDRENYLCPLAADYAQLIAAIRPEYLTENTHRALERDRVYGTGIE